MAKNQNNKSTLPFQTFKVQESKAQFVLFAALWPIYGYSVVFEIFKTRMCKNKKMAISWQMAKNKQ